MKIDIDFNEDQKVQIIRQLLEEQFEVISGCNIFDDNMDKFTLSESLKNIIYWNSTEEQYKKFIAKYKGE